MAPKSKSAKYYSKNKAARDKKKKYDTKLNASEKQKAKRRKLAKANYAHDKKHGKSSRRGKDLSHTSSGMKYKKTSVNRGSKKDTAGDRRARGKKRR